ncbi:unnamed protein product, partial [Protopolystoma xenopodis]
MPSSFTEPLPIELGIHGMLEYLVENAAHEHCVVGALKWFADNVCCDFNRPPAVLALHVYHALALHAESPDLVIACLRILGHATMTNQIAISLGTDKEVSNSAGRN